MDSFLSMSVPFNASSGFLASKRRDLKLCLKGKVLLEPLIVPQRDKQLLDTTLFAMNVYIGPDLLSMTN